MSLEELKYPIGRFLKPIEINTDKLRSYISDISSFPGRLKHEVQNLTNEQLDTPYRPDGWTIRQVVNHCADSHMNALIRLKLGLTEDHPTIKPYLEDRWAELADGKLTPIEPALKILEGVHERWTILLNNMKKEEFKRKFIHPEHESPFQLDENTALYAWHCNHHLAHITTLKKTKGW